MAVKQASTAAAPGTASAGATGAAPQAAQPAAPRGVTLATSPLRTMSNSLPQPNQLTTDGKAYVADLIEKVGAHNVKCKATCVAGLEIRLFMTEDEQYGFVLGMAETYQPIEGIPVTEKLTQIINTELAEILPKGIHLIQSVVVCRYDYPQIDAMANHIARCLMVTSQKAAFEMNIATLGNEQFTVSLDQGAVSAFVRQYAPQATVARDDVGVLVSVSRRTGRMNTFTNKEEYENTPILALTAYTKILVNNNQFIPVATISDIVASIPHRGLIAVAMAVAADALISRQAYLRPYTKFSKDSMNLGNLIPGADGHMWAAADMNQTNEFIAKYMTPPFLAIDVTEGRARIPGIDAMLANNGAVMAREISAFLGVDVTGIPAVINQTMEYTGITKTVDGLVDSRKIDYLYLASKGVKDIGAISSFLYPVQDPRSRIQQVTEHQTDTVPLYTTWTCVLNAPFVVAIGTCIAQGARLTYDSTMRAIDYNIQQLLTSQGANQFTGGISINNRMGGFGNNTGVNYAW